MRDYGKVSPQFWIGKTGKALRKEGLQAQMVALYLITCPHANMIGLYYLPQMYVAHDTGLSAVDVALGIAGCVAAGLCLYDDATEMVWVCEMAKYQIADALKDKDLRIKGVQNEFDSLLDNPFKSVFFERYGAVFCMKDAQAPSMPLAGQEQEQEQEQEKEQKREQEHKPAPAAAKSRHPAKSPLPADFGISDRVRTWAVQRQVQHLDLHLENFVSACKRKGYVYADWDEALMEAIRKDWAELGPSARSARSAASGKLGRAGQATAMNAQQWLESADASH